MNKPITYTFLKRSNKYAYTVISLYTIHLLLNVWCSLEEDLGLKEDIFQVLKCNTSFQFTNSASIFRNYSNSAPRGGGMRKEIYKYTAKRRGSYHSDTVSVFLNIGIYRTSRDLHALPEHNENIMWWVNNLWRGRGMWVWVKDKYVNK